MTKWWIAPAAFLFAGCMAATEGTTGGTDPGHEATLEHFEADFTPSDHDPVQRTVNAGGDSMTTGVDSSKLGVADLPLEFVPGFRVQIFASTSIDAANQKKAEAEALFPNEWFYLHYDPPTYKVRAGNFQQRYEADRFVRQVAEQGFKEAWAVPEKVIKDPPVPKR
jgi:hypothetical protein